MTETTSFADSTSIQLTEEPPRSALQRFGAYFVRTPALWTYVVLAVLVIVFSILSSGNFATTANLKSMLVDGSLLLIIAVGMTMVIITSGIDLSVGAVSIFASVIAAKVMGAIGGEGTGAILAGLVAAVVIGVLWGVVNGIMVGYLRIVALIATLGSLGMATGLALVITSGVNVRSVPTTLLLGFGNGSLFGVPWLIVVAVIVAVIGYLYLSKTRAGLYLYSVGSNEDGALRSGVKVRFNIASVYAISGALAGLAGFLSLARFGTTALAGHTTDNLQAIAAVVLGGTSLFGGRGGIGGTIAGVFIPVVLANGFVILGLEPFWQQFAIGLVLVLAVFADQVRRKRFNQE